MAYVPTKLAQSAPANTSETTIYTVPDGTKCIVKQIIVANVTSSTATLSISFVPSGDSAGDSNRIMEAQSLAANSSTSIDLSQVLVAGDFISIQVGTSDAITVTVSGIEFSGEGVAAFKDFDLQRLSSGNLTLNSTSWANVNTGLDLTLDAAPGDIVEVGVSGVVLSNAVVVLFDAATVVGGVVQNVVSLGGAEVAANDGIMAWRPEESANSNFGGSQTYTLLSDDVSSGEVTLRFRYKTATAANKTLLANSNQQLMFWAINHGVSSAAAVPAPTTAATDGQVLTADSAEDNGVVWADAASAVEIFKAESTSNSSTGFTPASPTSDTLVPDMELTITASGDARTALVSSAIVFTKVNGLRFKVYLDGSAVWPSITNGSRESSITDDTNQKIWTGAGILVAIPGDSSSHTIDVRAQASASTDPTTFNHRTLVAQVHDD